MQKYISPFTLECAKCGYDMVGGKPDDVTVIAAMLVNHMENQ